MKLQPAPASFASGGGGDGGGGGGSEAEFAVGILVTCWTAIERITNLPTYIWSKTG